MCPARRQAELLGSCSEVKKFRLLKGRKISFYLSITMLTLCIVILLTAALQWAGHRESSSAAMEMTERLFGEIPGRVEQQLQQMLGTVAMVTDAGAEMPRTMGGELPGAAIDGVLAFMLSLLGNAENVYSLTISESSTISVCRGAH